MQQVAGFTKKVLLYFLEPTLKIELQYQFGFIYENPKCETIFFRTHFKHWIAVSIWIHLRIQNAQKKKLPGLKDNLVL